MTNTPMRHTKAITFDARALIRREHRDTRTFPFETDEDRVHVVDVVCKDEWIWDMWKFFEYARVFTQLHTTSSENGLPVDAVQFQARGGEDGPALLTFRFHTHEDKLNIANWIETTLCKPFLCDGVTVRIGAIATPPVATTPAVPTELRAVSDELFALRQTMPDQTYVRLSNALKRPRE